MKLYAILRQSGWQPPAELQEAASGCARICARDLGTGRALTVSFTAAGHITSLSLHGHVLVNICAALS